METLWCIWYHSTPANTTNPSPLIRGPPTSCGTRGFHLSFPQPMRILLSSSDKWWLKGQHEGDGGCLRQSPETQTQDRKTLVCDFCCDVRSVVGTKHQARIVFTSSSRILYGCMHHSLEPIQVEEVHLSRYSFTVETCMKGLTEGCLTICQRDSEGPNFQSLGSSM
jgi:hypothetical protein